MDKPGRILALDYGKRKIGVAVSDETGTLARPLAVLTRVNRRADLRKLRELIQSHRATTVLVGHPRRLDGTKSEMTEEAARFAKRIEKEAGVIVELVEERLTSWEAEALQAELGKHGQADAIAAAVILRDYLQARKPPKIVRGSKANR